MRRPRMKRKGRKRQRFKVEERAAPSRRCAPPGGAPFNNVDAPGQEVRPSVPGPGCATHQSGGAGKLGAGEHLTLLGAARLEDFGDRRRGFLSRFLSEEAKRLKVKCPPRACPSPQGPAGTCARHQLGPSAQRGASRMNGSLWALLRPAKPYFGALSLPSREVAAAVAAAEVEGVGLGAQARAGSYPRRGTRMEKAGNRCSREDAQGHFVTTLLVTS